MQKCRHVVHVETSDATCSCIAHVRFTNPWALWGCEKATWCPSTAETLSLTSEMLQGNKHLNSEFAEVSNKLVSYAEIRLHAMQCGGASNRIRFFHVDASKCVMQCVLTRACMLDA